MGLWIHNRVGPSETCLCCQWWETPGWNDQSPRNLTSAFRSEGFRGLV